MIDTFSGIGGFSLAARWLGGIETVQFVERDPYCQRILAKHWPTVPIYDDITTFQPQPGSADVICGGFPCQDISTAGKQAGIKEGTRSGLFYELMRVVRLVGPRYVVLENVAAITSNGLDAVLGTLAEAGFDAEWACIPAADVGACHRRDRWWCVAYANGQRCDQGEHARNADGEHAPQRADGLSDALAFIGDGTDTADWPRQNTEPADLKGQQCDDGGLAHSARPTRTAAQFGNGDGSDASHPKGHGWRQGDPNTSGCAEGTGKREKQGSRDVCGALANTSSQRLERRWPSGSTAHRLSSNWRSYLSEPVLCRGDDGLSGRVDRLKALGNAVVPQVAMIPLSRVLADYQ
jgi:DNA (cytosine-5)-methyltransferase 1